MLAYVEKYLKGLRVKQGVILDGSIVDGVHVHVRLRSLSRPPILKRKKSLTGLALGLALVGHCIVRRWDDDDK
jgi:hypothetical protein